MKEGEGTVGELYTSCTQSTQYSLIIILVLLLVLKGKLAILKLVSMHANTACAAFRDTHNYVYNLTCRFRSNFKAKVVCPLMM